MLDKVSETLKIILWSGLVCLVGDLKKNDTKPQPYVLLSFK